MEKNRCRECGTLINKPNIYCSLHKDNRKQIKKENIKEDKRRADIGNKQPGYCVTK